MVECTCPANARSHKPPCPMAPARPDWDEYGMIMAKAAMTRAACTRRQVGAVITDSMHRTLATGYNGTVRGAVNCSEGGCPRGQLSYAEHPAYGSYDNCCGYHAEKNAADTLEELHPGIDLTGSTIYVTHDPCDDCAALITRIGIERVISPNSRR